MFETMIWRLDVPFDFQQQCRDHAADMNTQNLVSDCELYLDSGSRNVAVGVFAFYVLATFHGFPMAFKLVATRLIRVHHSHDPDVAYKISTLMVLVFSEMMYRYYDHKVDGWLCEDLGVTLIPQLHRYPLFSCGSCTVDMQQELFGTLFKVLHEWSISATLHSISPSS